ncbi:MAG TPA: hypothetical protein VFY16_13495 [Gemmatimonadaceae bacterium]|nr:hypothetical protein [Gemmatimonadaceae bacterium]
MTELLRVDDHLHVLTRHVLEECGAIHLLLEVAADCRPVLLADDGDDRLTVELRIVEAVQKVYRARPAGGQTDADVAREPRVRAGGERRHLLVRDLRHAAYGCRRRTAP